MLYLPSTEKQLRLGGSDVIFSTIVMNISDLCHSVKIIVEEHAQVRKFLVCLTVKEVAIVCGIEIKRIAHLLLVFEVEISAMPYPQESVKVVRLERPLAVGSAEFIRALAVTPAHHLD